MKLNKDDERLFCKDFYSQKEHAKAMGCSPRLLTLWNTKGILRPIRAGHPYVYMTAKVKEFYDRFGGFDLGNANKVDAAIRATEAIYGKKS